MIGNSVEAAIDATGLESQYRSHYYILRSGKSIAYKHFLKLTVVYDTDSQFALAASVCRGPGNDSPQFPGCMTKAASRTDIHRVLADAGYDSEANHRLCREELDIPETLIPLMPRNTGGQATTRYRMEMQRALPDERFGQRWQSESGHSRFKRRLDSDVAARTWDNQVAEALLRVLTYDLMIVLCLQRTQFFERTNSLLN